ncbi:HNH endonuclease [Dysgonomonas sp. ZJ709]|uniref:HNH endonuclease n=1 Tax=Dysgonomonas sp. ZJ709 TaxID=2709797 RepID=UPI0013EA6996|nr:HNH endonuclease [Dysgonomonas sp. ZJ709]
MYTSENIIWIKNVKRKDGFEWAYGKDSKILNWSTKRKGNAITPKIGDIIILFQKPKLINGVKNNNVFLTHLVSPISNDVLIDDESEKHKWYREIEVVACADPMFMIPKPINLNFTTVNTGLSYLIQHIGNNKLSESLLQETIWNLFTPYLVKQDKEVLSDVDADLIAGLSRLEDEALEGQLDIIEHINKEVFNRNAVIVRKAKEEALKNGNGRILCECCKFDFLKVYGVLGYGFIECHHKIAIREGERITRVKDIALVCSNCHSMLHRINNDGHHYSIEELTLLIHEQKNLI